jgi:tetratricopeptide (TPR) repeat protein
MLVFAGALTIDAVANPPEPRRPLPPAVLAAHGITLSMIGLDVALNLYKRKQLPSYRYAARPQEDFGQDAWRLYREGERLLALGALGEARAEYGRIVRFCGGSDALPWAVCRIADILYLEGGHAAAAREYTRMVREYPLPQLYDRCCKNLADLHFCREQYEESLRWLGEMVFCDPVFSREEIDFYRCEILESWARQDPAVRPRLIRQLTEFTERYPESDNLELGRRKLAEWTVPAS